MSDLTDAYAGMDLRGLAAAAIRERDQLRMETRRLADLLRASDLHHIRLRAGCLLALAALAWSATLDEREAAVAELRRLVTT